MVQSSMDWSARPFGWPVTMDRTFDLRTAMPVAVLLLALLVVIPLGVMTVVGQHLCPPSPTPSKPTASRAYLPSTAAKRSSPNGPGVTKGRMSRAEETKYLGHFPDLETVARRGTAEEKRRMVQDKELYFKLQNIEDHPDALHLARERLDGLFEQTMSAALAQPNPNEDSILSIGPYSPARLRDLLLRAHRSNATKYEAYLCRRRSGGPREMFPTHAHAKEWLRLAAVVKYVDGGWLGGVLVTPGEGEGAGRRAEGSRRSAKMAWQVMSEEYGDGDLQKNHVDLYYRLVDSLGIGARAPIPSQLEIVGQGHTLHGWEKGFDGLAPDEGAPRCWTAALAQLCIGLLAAHDRLPEALGFNMSYETLPYHLLVTTCELRELGIDDTYFALHVTIDNLHTGHAALSRLAVEAYLEAVPPGEREEQWSRVQRGFVLADGLPTTPWGPIEFEPTLQGWRPRCSPTSTAATSTSTAVVSSTLGPPLRPGVDATPQEMDMARLLVDKAQAAEKMHCPSRVRIGGRTIEQWLDPACMTVPNALKFARALAGARPWVFPGDPAKSRLVREVEWGGRMFGAFSRHEVAVVKLWIESLSTEPGQDGSSRQEVSMPNPQKGSTMEVNPSRVLSSSSDAVPTTSIIDMSVFDQLGESNPTPLPTLLASSPSPPLSPFENIRETILASLTMLDHFTLSPTRLATPLGMCVIRLLRAQLGFPSLHTPTDICAGTDHFTPDISSGSDDDDPTEDVMGIYELLHKSRLEPGQSSTSKELVGKKWQLLAELRRRPYANSGILLGILAALLPLHIALVGVLNDASDRRTLRRIVEEERQALLDYWTFLETQPEGEIHQRRMRGGYVWATDNLVQVTSSVA